MTKLMRLLVTVAAAGGLAATVAGCAPPPATVTAGSDLAPISGALAGAADHRGPAADADADSGARVDKMLVFVVENRTLDRMLAHMAFVRDLSATYAYADHYYAIRHPSLPNYLAILGGRTFGVSSDGPPATHTAWGPSVFGQAVAAGRSAKLYAEGMPSHCALTSGPGRYAVRHNPWAYFPDERDMCARYDVSFRGFARDVAAGSLPTVGMVVPDLCNDAHDCTLATADAWIRAAMRTIMSGPDWESGRLAVVITADEDDSRHDNRVLTVLAHPSLHGGVVTQPLTHYSLSRALAEVAGVPALNHAADAPSLLGAFGLHAAA